MAILESMSAGAWFAVGWACGIWTVILVPRSGLRFYIGRRAASGEPRCGLRMVGAIGSDCVRSWECCAPKGHEGDHVWAAPPEHGEGGDSDA